MFGGRHVFRGWANTDVASVHRRFVPYKLGNDGKRGTRRGGGPRAIMLAWKSWKRGPEGQPLLPTFRVQTIAICLVAAGIMQRALCHSVTRLVLLVKVINKRHASVFLFLFLFRHPRPIILHLFLSLSLARARSRHQTGIRWWRTAKTRSTFIPRIYECLRIFRPPVWEFVAGIQPKNYNRACIMSTP